MLSAAGVGIEVHSAAIVAPRTHAGGQHIEYVDFAIVAVARSPPQVGVAIIEGLCRTLQRNEQHYCCQ